MKFWKRIVFVLSIATIPTFANAQCDDDDLPSGSISASSMGCGGGSVILTFSLSGDDDGLYDVRYRIGGSTFTLTNIRNGHTVNHNVTSSTTATLISVTSRDDDDDDVCTANVNQTINIVTGENPSLRLNTTPPSCNQSNGSITAQATGGRSPYQFSLNGGVTRRRRNLVLGLGLQFCFGPSTIGGLVAHLSILIHTQSVLPNCGIGAVTFCRCMIVLLLS